MRRLLWLAIASSSLTFLACARPSVSVNGPGPTPPALPTPSVTAASDTGSGIGRAESVGIDADFPGTAGVTEKRPELQQPALLTAVRTGQQANFDRIVFQFSGENIPGYHVEYIDKPVRACGSGEVVPLQGDAWLEIKFYPANAHNEDGKPTVTNRSMAPDHTIVKELKSTCDFEADVTWVAGAASPNKYRVLELKEPARLVVDIKH